MQEQYTVADIDNNLYEYLLSSENYKLHVKPMKQYIIENQDINLMEAVCSNVKYLINEENYSPLGKLNAIRLIKELHSQNRQAFQDLIDQYLVDDLEKIGYYEKESQSDDRGKTYFPEGDSSQLYGNSFLRLVLETIFVFGKWYKDSRVRKLYIAMKKDGVKFPDVLNYYKDQNNLLKEEDSDIQTPQISVGNGKYSSDSNNKIRQDLNDDNTHDASMMSQASTVFNAYEEENQRNSQKYKKSKQQFNLRQQSPRNLLYSSRNGNQQPVSSLTISRNDTNASQRSIYNEKKMSNPIYNSVINRQNDDNYKFNVQSQYGPSSNKKNKFDIQKGSQVEFADPNSQQGSGQKGSSNQDLIKENEHLKKENIDLKQQVYQQKLLIEELQEKLTLKNGQSSTNNYFQNPY